MEPFFCEDIRQAIEALLFVAGEPLSVAKIAEIVNSSEETVLACLKELEDFYNDRGFHPVEIGRGWQFLTADSTLPYVEKLYKPKAANLSKASLETLAIIAYCQPITRGEIEAVRGVNADHIVSSLLSKELICEVGRKDIPGKPILFGTSEKFLEILGLNSLEELPPMPENKIVDNAEKNDNESEGD